MPASVLMRASMTSFKSKRSWSRSRFSRPSSTTPSPTSPKQSSIPPSSPPSAQNPLCKLVHQAQPQSQQQHSPQRSLKQQHQQQSQQNSAPTSPNQLANQNPPPPVLRHMRNLLSDFEQIHKVNQTPLTDSRIRHIRLHIEKSMPRLYSLQQQMINHSSSEASRILFMAEDCLKHFPDVDDAFLRTLKPTSQNKPPENASSHPQPRFPSLHSMPSSYSSKPPLHHANPSVNTSNAPPTTTPSPHNYHYFSPPSGTPHQHDSFAPKPPCIPTPVTDHRPSLTTAQQMLLHSVHSLSSNYRQPFAHTLYDAPAALSPMEIESISAAINRQMTFSSTPSGAGAVNSGGYAYGHAQYASRRETDAPRYHAWDAVKTRHESSLYAATPRSGSTNPRHRRSNSNDE